MDICIFNTALPRLHVLLSHAHVPDLILLNEHSVFTNGLIEIHFITNFTIEKTSLLLTYFNSSLT